MPTNDVLDQLRDAAAAKDAIPDHEKADPANADRLIGDPIGVDDHGVAFPGPQMTGAGSIPPVAAMADDVAGPSPSDRAYDDSKRGR